MAGINRALHEQRHLAKVTADRPCIFLSHISIDKSAASAVGSYIMSQGDIDIYLDVNDPELMNAVITNDPGRVTHFIETGLAHSTHIMCLVSGNTVKSWWVPYELGFAKNAGKYLSTLKLKGDVELPAFLEIGEIIRGTKTLNWYLNRVRRDLSKQATNAMLLETLIPHTASAHPLDNHLDWNA